MTGGWSSTTVLALVIALIGSGGIGGLITALTIPATRRKLNSAATLEISQSAAVLAQEMRANAHLARSEMDELRTAVRRLTAELDDERTRRVIAETRLIAITGVPPDPPPRPPTGGPT